VKNSVCATTCIVLAAASNAWAGQLKLNQGWRFRPDSTNAGVSQRWYEADTSEGWEPIKVGKSWEVQGYPYDGYGWYRTQFTLPADAGRGGRVVIRFGAVDERARIWLNGRFIRAVAVGWNVPFEVDVTAAVRYGQPNQLAIQVHDSALQGGIWKPVTVKYADKAEKPAAVKRLEREGVRAISAAVGSDDQGGQIVQTGLNTLLRWAYMLQGATARKVPPGEDFVAESDIAGRLGGVLREANLARKYNLVYVPNIWFHTDSLPFMTNNEYRRCVSLHGTRCRITPCPVDEGYWDRLMLPLLKMLAEIEKKAGCSGGAALDLEFYTGDFSGGFCYNKTAVQGCYCDHCFGEFLKSRGEQFRSKDFELTKRADYIRQNYSLRDYLDFQELQVEQKVRSVADRVRKIKPDFMLGMLPFRLNWYLKGVARGMSAPGLPVLIFSEREYSRGFNARTAESVAWLRKEGIPARLIGGLMIGAYTGMGMGAKAAELACRADGYWLYHGQVLYNPNARILPRGKHSEYKVQEPTARYWEAMKLANAWLDKGARLYQGEPAGEMPILTPATVVKPPEQVIVSEKGIEITPLPDSGSLVANGDFTRPFASAWRTFDQPPKIVDLPDRDGRAVLFDCKVRTRDTYTSSFFQTVKVDPPKRYRVKVDVRTESLELGKVGVQVFHTDKSEAMVNNTVTLSDCPWTTLSGDFAAARPEVHLVLLANGVEGKIWIANVRMHQIDHFRLETKRVTLPKGCLPLKVVLPELPGDARLRCFLADPLLERDYFRVAPQTDLDLRYLGAIYGDVPLGFLLEFDLERSSRPTRITPGRLLYYKGNSTPTKRK